MAKYYSDRVDVEPMGDSHGVESFEFELGNGFEGAPRVFGGRDGRLVAPNEPFEVHMGHGDLHASGAQFTITCVRDGKRLAARDGPVGIQASWYLFRSVLEGPCLRSIGVPDV
jgi:hypothetical protein